MLNEPQNWSVSLSPSNTSYTLSLDKEAGTNTLQVFLFCLGASHGMSEHPPRCISFRCNSSALIQKWLHFSIKSVPSHVCGATCSWGQGALWVMSVALKDRVPALHGALEQHLPGISRRNPLAPALPPSCAAFLAVPTPGLCNCLRGRKGHSRWLF